MRRLVVLWTLLRSAAAGRGVGDGECDDVLDVCDSPRIAPITSGGEDSAKNAQVVRDKMVVVKVLEARAMRSPELRECKGMYNKRARLVAEYKVVRKKHCESCEAYSSGHPNSRTLYEKYRKIYHKIHYLERGLESTAYWEFMIESAVLEEMIGRSAVSDENRAKMWEGAEPIAELRILIEDVGMLKANLGCYDFSESRAMRIPEHGTLVGELGRLLQLLQTIYSQHSEAFTVLLGYSTQVEALDPGLVGEPAPRGGGSSRSTHVRTLRDEIVDVIVCRECRMGRRGFQRYYEMCLEYVKSSDQSAAAKQEYEASCESGAPGPLEARELFARYHRINEETNRLKRGLVNDTTHRNFGRKLIALKEEIERLKISGAETARVEREAEVIVKARTLIADVGTLSNGLEHYDFIMAWILRIPEYKVFIEELAKLPRQLQTILRQHSLVPGCGPAPE